MKNKMFFAENRLLYMGGGFTAGGEGPAKETPPAAEQAEKAEGANKGPDATKAAENAVNSAKKFEGNAKVEAGVQAVTEVEAKMTKEAKATAENLAKIPANETPGMRIVRSPKGRGVSPELAALEARLNAEAGIAKAPEKKGIKISDAESAKMTAQVDKSTAKTLADLESHGPATAGVLKGGETITPEMDARIAANAAAQNADMGGFKLGNIGTEKPVEKAATAIAKAPEQKGIKISDAERAKMTAQTDKAEAKFNADLAKVASSPTATADVLKKAEDKRVAEGPVETTPTRLAENKPGEVPPKRLA